MATGAILTVVFLFSLTILWLYSDYKILYGLEPNLFTKCPPNLRKYALLPRIHSCESINSVKIRTIILVTSNVINVERRNAHRIAMPVDHLRQINAERVFVIGQLASEEKNVTEEDLYNESRLYNDIVQGFFTDTEENLTHKHLLALHWATTFCEKAKYILKVDDNTVFTINILNDILEKENPIDTNSFLLGSPSLNIDSNMLDDSIYASAFVMGNFYITTNVLATRLIQESSKQPYLENDDVFVSGLLMKSLGLRPKFFSRNVVLRFPELFEKCLEDMLHKKIFCDAIGINIDQPETLIIFNEAYKNCKDCVHRSANEFLNQVPPKVLDDLYIYRD